MSYTKQTWATGDIITAEKLNHMEDGIAGAGETPIHMLKATITNSTVVAFTSPMESLPNFEDGVYKLASLEVDETAVMNFIYAEANVNAQNVYFVQIKEGYKATATDPVNCQYIEADNTILITDPSLDASITLAISTGTPK